MAERLALSTSDHGVAGSNPAGGEILPEPKRRFIAQSLSCSPFHRLELTEILLKGRKTLTHPSILPYSHHLTSHHTCLVSPTTPHPTYHNPMDPIMSHIPYCTPPYHSVPYHTLALSHFTSPHLTSSHPSPTLPYPSLPHPTLQYATDPTVPNPTLSFSIPIQPQSPHPKLTLPYSTRHKHSLTYPTEIKLYGNVKVTRYTFIDTHSVTIDQVMYFMFYVNSN